MRTIWNCMPFASPSKPRGARQMGVVDEVELAFSARSRLATGLGFVLGGVIPIATYLEVHFDLDHTRPLHGQAATYMIAGGLLFSAKTVFAWGRRAFRDPWKALGFVALLEGVMVTSDVHALATVLLAILVAINGIATGCVLSLDRTAAKAAPPTNAPPLQQQESVLDARADSELRTAIVPVSRKQRRTGGNEASQKRFAFVSDAS